MTSVANDVRKHAVFYSHFCVVAKRDSLAAFPTNFDRFSSHFTNKPDVPLMTTLPVAIATVLFD